MFGTFFQTLRASAGLQRDDDPKIPSHREVYFSLEIFSIEEKSGCRIALDPC
jgi:hypothetical protein